MSASRQQQACRRILIVDDQPLLRRGLAGLIEAEPDLTVCAEITTHQIKFETIASSNADMIITDLALGHEVDSDGIDLVKGIRAQDAELPILVLSAHDGSTYVRRALDAGANGCVSKRVDGPTLLVAIRMTLSGQTYLSSDLAGSGEIR